MARTTADACGREVREEMSLSQRLGEGSQSSSGDFVFAVGFLHTEPQFLTDSWERQQPGLGREGSGILQRPHVAATSFTPLFFFPSWRETRSLGFDSRLFSTHWIVKFSFLK